MIQHKKIKPRYFIGAGLLIAVAASFGVVSAIGNSTEQPAQSQAIRTVAKRSVGSSKAVTPKTIQTPAATKPVTSSQQVSSTPQALSLIGTSLFSPQASSQPAYAAAQQATGSDAAVLKRLAQQPVAAWFGDWNGDVRSAVDAVVSVAAAAKAVPVLVAYDIPNRDCNGQSSGGASSPAAYSNWIQSFAQGLRGRQAIVVLEPDAVAADCFTGDRAALLAAAVPVLTEQGARVYLDGGNPTWRTPTDIASRLKRAGIAAASGFSLNVSNFQATAANVAYGTQVSNLVGGKHFIVDTSRNGAGSSADNAWCNPGGRALGSAPTLQTGVSLADAYLWIKVPGESDGVCGPMQSGTSAPSAGSFWPAYALMLARNAGW